MKLVIDKNSNFTHEGGAPRETPKASTASSPTGQMAHTPLPWKPYLRQDGSAGVGSDGWGPIAEIHKSSVHKRDEVFANAEYIVTACNSFPAFMASLKELVWQLRQSPVAWADSILRAEELIAKAESGQSAAPESHGK